MKRRIIQIVVLLLLGTIMNIAVAWADRVAEELQTRQQLFPVRVQADGVHSLDGALITTSEVISLDIDEASGWPLSSLQSNLLASLEAADNHLTWTWDGGFYIRGMRLPLHPLWNGFVLNTLIYSVALGAISLIPDRVRRAIRRRRGLCPACAYPIGTSPVCTECGKPVRQRSAISDQQSALDHQS